jgi:hypothetical protein
MQRVFVLALAFALATMAALPARAEPIMGRFAGEWVGTGQVLMGLQRGTTFRCELKNDPSDSQVNFDMNGRCWLGNLSAAVNAQLRYYSDTSQYYGKFLNGAEGMGCDIVGGRAGEAISLKLMRGTLQGRLKAERVGPDQMKVTLFYRDAKSDRELPVVAMGFARKGTDRLPDYLSEIVTGSISP